MKIIYVVGGAALVVLLVVLVGFSSPRGGTIELTGAVRLGGGDDRAPNGARVFVHPVVERDFADATELTLELAPRGAQEAAVVDGKYRLSVPQPGVYAVAVAAPGFSPQAAQLDLRRDTQHDVRLSAEGFSFDLQLEDVAGAAIAEGEVSVYAHHGQLISRQRADSQGRVFLRLPGGEYRFVFHAPGFVPHARSILVLADEQRPIILSRAATLDVKVAGPRADGATLAVVDGLGRLAALGRTQADGTARFPALLAGKYEIWAGQVGLEGAATLVLSAGQAASVELALKEQNPLRVPLPQSCEPALTVAAPTQDGRILRHSLPFEVREGELVLNQPPLGLRAELGCDGRVAHLELPGSGSLVAEPTWRSVHEVRGRVLNPDGGALVGALISVTTAPAAAGAAPWRFTTISRADGGFAVPGVPEGSASLAATHPRLGRVTHEEAVAASTPPRELRFNAGYFVAGKVLDAGGAPVAHATVAFASPVGGNASQTSDAQGAFRIGPLGADQGLLVAFVDGRLAHDIPLAVSAENLDHAELVLNRLKPTSERGID